MSLFVPNFKLLLVFMRVISFGQKHMCKYDHILFQRGVYNEEIKFYKYH